jgi:stage V sporulation protein R
VTRGLRRAGLTAPLEDARRRIEELARAAGLDFFDTHFELCDPEEINMVAAYGGFPVRYPHWRWGMEYLRMQKGYEYGLQKIYELVINTDPACAYLLDTNGLVDQQLVMAHVYAHVDFFKNNAWFAGTDRRMLDAMANHATRVRRMIDRHGAIEVEQWLDLGLSLDNLVDPNGGALPPRATTDDPPWGRAPEALEAHVHATQSPSVARHERDVLGYLVAHAPLQPWQAELLSMLREEARYFLPQIRTKIMNEGWASFWHTRLMTGAILDDAGVVDYADHHAATVATTPHRLNPYKLGLAVFRAIERQHGLARAFEVRRTHNDVTFLDTFLTEEVCADAGLFAWTVDRRTGARVIEGRDVAELRSRLLFDVATMGQPRVAISDANHGGRGELELTHAWEGVDLQLDWAAQVMANLARVWRRPVHLRTRVEGRDAWMHHDGETLRAEGLRAVPAAEGGRRDAP